MTIVPQDYFTPQYDTCNSDAECSCNQRCGSSNRCVADSSTNQCPSGSTCSNGSCACNDGRGLCNGNCCPAGSHCDNGLCLSDAPACQTQGCPTCQVCTASGCGPATNGTSCGTCRQCSGGSCVNSAAGTSCGSGHHCNGSGSCIADPPPCVSNGGNCSSDGTCCSGFCDGGACNSASCRPTTTYRGCDVYVYAPSGANIDSMTIQDYYHVEGPWNLQNVGNGVWKVVVPGSNSVSQCFAEWNGARVVVHALFHGEASPRVWDGYEDSWHQDSTCPAYYSHTYRPSFPTLNDCSNTSQCAAGQICKNGQCIAGCDSTHGCTTPGFTCVNDVCTDLRSCSPQNPCPDGKHCGANNLCVSCLDDSHCPTGYHCTPAGACEQNPTPTGCSDANPCPGGYECENGTCVRVTPIPAASGASVGIVLAGIGIAGAFFLLSKKR